MDIPALSVSLSQQNLSQAVGLQVLKMAKEQASAQGDALVQMMERSVRPDVGRHLDVKA